MATSLPPVNICFVAGGVSNVLQSIKTIGTAFAQLEAHNTAVVKAGVEKRISLYEKEAAARQAIDNKFNSTYKASLDKEVSAYSAAMAKKSAIDKQHQRQVSGGLGGAGHNLGNKSQVNPFSKIAGQMMTRFSPQMGQMASMGGEAGAAGGLGMAGGLALGGAVAAVAGSLMLLKKGVDLVVDGLTQAAHEMVGAVVEIGGGFSLQGSIVQASKVDAMATHIVNNAPKGQGVPKEELMKWATEQEKTGQYSRYELLEAASIGQGKSGDVKSTMASMEHTKALAAVAGTSLKDTAKLKATIASQFQELTPQQVDETATGMWSAGRIGTIELPDLLKSGKITANARKMHGGGTPENIMKMVMMSQLAGRIDDSPEEAITSVQSFMSETAQKAPKISAITGVDAFKKQKDGSWQLQDPAKLLAHALTMNPKQMAELYGPRGSKVVEGARSYVGERQQGESDKDYVARAEKMLEGFEKVGNAADELAEANKKVKETVESQLLNAFNLLKTAVGDDLFNVIKGNMDAIKGFINDLPKNLPVLVTEFETLIAVLPVIGTAMTIVAKLILGIAASLGSKDAEKALKDLDDRENKRGKYEDKNIASGNVEGWLGDKGGSTSNTLNVPGMPTIASPGVTVGIGGPQIQTGPIAGTLAGKIDNKGKPVEVDVKPANDALVGVSKDLGKAVSDFSAVITRFDMLADQPSGTGNRGFGPAGRKNWVED